MKIFGNWENNNKDFLNLIVEESKKSKEILFVSGFSSLGFFAHLFKEIYLDPKKNTKKIKFIIGNEVTKPFYKIKEGVYRIIFWQLVFFSIKRSEYSTLGLIIIG